MRTNLIAMTLLAAGIAPAADVKSAATVDATAAYSRLKSLAGEWEANTTMGKLHLTYEVIAGGTAVVEREDHGAMGEMLTVYHMDGKRLMLTHYCLAGNQPRMELKSYQPESGELVFRFLDITNLASPTAAHIHNGTLRLIDHEHLSGAWEFQTNGKSEVHEAQLTRVK